MDLGSVTNLPTDTNLKGLSGLNAGNANALPEMLEVKAAELSGMNDVMTQTEVLDRYKDMAKGMQNPDSIKSVVKQQVRQVAINHFAGKEEQLKQAMETISKYKNKYSSLNSLEDIKKRRPNEMKGKPFIERFVPGISLQIQKKGDDFMVDFNAYAGYRFTGKLNAGVGWNQRIAYNTNYNGFNPDARIFGPRIFSEYALWKGFSPRAELEVMNTNVPIITTTDPLEREWVWGAFIGLKKEYSFVKNIKGTVLIMTRLFNPDHKSPYADVLNVRFGFEFPMKKKTSGN